MADPAIPTIVALGEFVAGDDSPLHALVRRFRSGDPDAYGTVRDAALEALAGWRGSQRGEGLVVAVPGHEPGEARRPLDALTDELAAAIGWTPPAEPPLRRVTSAPEAKLGRAEPADAVARLRWGPSGCPGSLVLVDDVIRTGGSVAACVEAIRTADPACAPALVLVVARAREAKPDRPGGDDAGVRP